MLNLAGEMALCVSPPALGVGRKSQGPRYEMFSSNFGRSPQRVEQVRVNLPEEAVHRPSFVPEGRTGADVLSDSCLFGNPYAPPHLGVEEHASPSRVATAFDKTVTRVKDLIENAKGTATTKFVAGFVFCKGAAVTVWWGLYQQITDDSFSVLEYPQTLFVGGALGVTLLYAGSKCGVVLAHRAWTARRKERC
ncbi:MAG: hypothetical protein RL518_2599 [Pseudomonadota bacterium]